MWCVWVCGGERERQREREREGERGETHLFLEGGGVGRVIRVRDAVDVEIQGHGGGGGRGRGGGGGHAEHRLLEREEIDRALIERGHSFGVRDAVRWKERKDGKEQSNGENVLHATADTDSPSLPPPHTNQPAHPLARTHARTYQA